MHSKLLWESCYTYMGHHCKFMSVSYYNHFLLHKDNFNLRQSQILVHSNNFSVAGRQPRPSIPLNITRYRKAVYSALWVQVTLVVCYLPSGIVIALTQQNGPISVSLYLARQFTVTLVYLNSSLNPLLYFWKIREVRQAVKETIKQLCCSPN